MVDSLKLDAAALRTLAHPLRTRLLTALRMDGPATATELAEKLSTNSGATSYHLRRLEAVGLVEDTGEGAGKRRLWRAATDSHRWTSSDFDGDDDAEAAQSWLVRDYLRQSGERFERWLDVEPTWPAAWRDVTGYSDRRLNVTPEQLRTLNEELSAVLDRYADPAGDDPDGPEVATLVEYYRAAAGEHPDWDEYSDAMAKESKTLIRLTVERWGPIATGGFPARLVTDQG